MEGSVSQFPPTSLPPFLFFPSAMSPPTSCLLSLSCTQKRGKTGGGGGGGGEGSDQQVVQRDSGKRGKEGVEEEREGKVLVVGEKVRGGTWLALTLVLFVAPLSRRGISWSGKSQNKCGRRREVCIREMEGGEKNLYTVIIIQFFYGYICVLRVWL